MKVDISKTNGDSEGRIDSLLNQILKAKEDGATHYKMSWTNDPNWRFKYFELYKFKSKEEIKQEKITKLEEELSKLKNAK